MSISTTRPVSSRSTYVSPPVCSSSLKGASRTQPCDFTTAGKENGGQADRVNLVLAPPALKSPLTLHVSRFTFHVSQYLDLPVHNLHFGMVSFDPAHGPFEDGVDAAGVIGDGDEGYLG